MSSINPLRFGVTGNQYYKQESSEESKQSHSKEAQTGSEQGSSVNSGTILEYMAAQNADIIPVSATKTYNVSKYVTPEQEASIASFINGFESDYDEAFETALGEFPELSEEAASSLALEYINSAYA